MHDHAHILNECFDYENSSFVVTGSVWKFLRGELKYKYKIIYSICSILIPFYIHWLPNNLNNLFLKKFGIIVWAIIEIHNISMEQC